MEQKTYATPDECWEAVILRDPQANGHFVFAVSTTGIYCRPGCSSRTPRRENVQFFRTWQEAEKAGFRACKRCQPNATFPPQQEIILRACRMMEEAETEPTLEELAGATGLSPWHFQRLFKKIVGITPKQYAIQRRSNQVRVELGQNDSVTGAIYEAGYGSSARFYSRSTDELGMKPGQYRRGGAGQTIQFAITSSYLGKVLVAATDHGICSIELGDSVENLERSLRNRFPAANLQPGNETFHCQVGEITAFLEHPQGGLGLPLDIQGTAFQRRVWAALREIPYGSTSSYAEVARKIGKPKAVRAVAQACAANKIAVAIPCHRVVQSDGGLGGYRWGVERKQKILEFEKHD